MIDSHNARTRASAVAAFAIALCSLVVSSALGAQSPADTAARPIEPREVRGSRATTVIGGASAMVIRPDSARTGVAPTLAELLRAVPQVLVRTNSRGQAELSVRGSDSRQISLVLNGLPLSPSWDGRADPSLIPLSGVGEVTYIRSTGSLLGGPNAIGGVVDMRITPPLLTGERAASLGSDETGATLLSASAGDANVVGDATLAFWRVGVGHRDRAGFTRAAEVPDPNPAAELRTNSDARQTDAFASIGVRGVRGGEITFLATGYESERGVPPELHLNTPRRWRYPVQARSALQLRGTSPALRSVLGATTVDLSAGVLDATMRIESFSDNTYTTVSAREAGDERVTSTRLGIDHAFGGGNSLRAAFTTNNVRYDETINADPTSRYRQRLSSAAIETQLAVGNRTLMSGGLALDAAETLESGGKAAAPRQELVGWRLGATTRLNDDWRAHSSLSRRARFPALRELYSGALNRFEPNPGLQPEKLTAAEAGLSWGAVEGGVGVGAQVVAFHHWLDDAVVRVPYLTTTRFIRVNRDQTRSSGGELTMGWRGAHGAELHLDFVAQRVRTRDAVAGGAAHRPELMPNLHAMLDGSVPTFGGARVGGSIAHVGSQYCVNAETSEDQALAAQTVAEVRVERSWRLPSLRAFRTMRVQLGADNLLDATVYEQCGLPRAGRTVRFGVSLQ